ncbi:UNVERIFIED_CONTAM: hypothetical protein NCL1_35616 [Trichonephila clavipes]
MGFTPLFSHFALIRFQMKKYRLLSLVIYLFLKILSPRSIPSSIFIDLLLQMKSRRLLDLALYRLPNSNICFKKKEPKEVFFFPSFYSKWLLYYKHCKT